MTMRNNNNGDTPDGEVEFTCNTLQCKCKYEFVEIDRGVRRCAEI